MLILRAFAIICTTTQTTWEYFVTYLLSPYIQECDTIYIMPITYFD
jgi:hypothetical protein